MAGREKKPALVKKQSISATASKDGDSPQEISAEKTSPAKSNAPKLEAVTQAPAPHAKSVLKSKKQNPTTKAIKKNLKIKFKAKTKTAKKLKLSKSIFKNTKHLDGKNITIVKNGIKKRGKQSKKSQAALAAESKGQNEVDLPPPVLEPMTNLPESNVTPKKEPKKRTKKQQAEDANEALLPVDPKKIKMETDVKETVEDVLNDVANELDLDIDTLMKKPGKKPRVTKKPAKAPPVRQKKPPTPKKPKGEGTRGKKPKETIIATLSKDFDMDTDAQNVINKLDLNVGKTIKKRITKKRRHSIEKFPSVCENQENPNFEQPFSLFPSIRRSASPRSKRNARIRQSVETAVTKRFSPYSTRSDSPARILRNGKHRKLKGTQLLDGLENEYKRRRRLGSEISSSDLKYSEYLSESDSNFSDMTSVTENGTCDSPKEEGVMTKSDLLRKEILDSITAPVPEVSELQNLNIKSISTKFTAILKRSLSTETSQLIQEAAQEDVKPKPEELNDSTFTDTNSNDVKPGIKPDFKAVPATSTPPEKDLKTDIACDSIKIKKEEIDETVIDKIASSPSYKVPEKSFILDQMKQIFNDSTSEDLERRTTRSSVKRSLKLSTSEDNHDTVPVAKFYGPETSTSPEKKKESSANIEIAEVTKTTEEKTVEEKTIENKTVEDKTVEVKTVEDKTVEDKIGEDKTVEDKIVEDKAVEDKTVENNIVKDKIIEDKIVEDKKVEENTVEEKTVEDKIVEDEPVEDEAVEEKSNTEEVAETSDIIEQINEAIEEIEQEENMDINKNEQVDKIETEPEEGEPEVEEEKEAPQTAQLESMEVETENIEETVIEKEIVKDSDDDLLTRLRENSAISISIKDTSVNKKKEIKITESEKKKPIDILKDVDSEDDKKDKEVLVDTEDEAMDINETLMEILAEEEEKKARELKESEEKKARELRELEEKRERDIKEAEEKIISEPSSEEIQKTGNDDKEIRESEEEAMEPEEAEEEEISNKASLESDETLEKSVEEPKYEETTQESTIDEAMDQTEEPAQEIVPDLPKEMKESESSETGSEKSVDLRGTNEAKNESPKSEPIITETPENQAIKENILSALGLQSLRAAEEAKLRDMQKPVNKNDVYTGTLKTVIKLNRSNDKKKGRNPLKMTLQKSKSRSSKDGDCDNMKSDGASGKNDGENACYKVMKETGSASNWRHGSHSSDTAGANRKSHYSNRSNPDGSSEQASDNDTPAAEEETTNTKALVIPEKASSFSIHPGRLCSDECAYCFGKFGLFDTPLHIAQIKSVERQDKILENEVYLMRDSCLCDACYRHVDRRNTGSACNTKTYKRNSTSSTIPRPNYCHVLACGRESTNVLRRKWLMKMKKSVAKLINVDLDNPGLHSIPVCAEHYAAVEHLMVCALCKRRLARNHIHYLGSECEMLNSALEKEGIPVTLNDKPVVCKLCRYFATLLQKPPSSESQSNTAEFFRQYRKRLLHFYDIEVMDEGEAEEPITVPMKEKSEKEVLKKKSKSKPSKSSKLNTSGGASNGSQPAEPEKTDQTRVPFNSENGESRASTPSDTVVDYETLVPNLSLECSDVEETKNEVPLKTMFRKLHPESVREAVEISKIRTRDIKNTLVERLGSNPSISVRQLFQGEEDLPLAANIDFNTVKDRTPEGWEKSVCTIQYDTDTKHLWQELQKPYGNQSSFLRHLILLEKYFRNGDLTLSPNASHHAVNYSVSVQNRLRAYDNIPSNSVPMQPLTMLPFNQVKKSQSGIITTRETPANMSAVLNAANLPKNTPIPISQLNPNFLTQLSVRQKTPSVPPGLISLQPGTNRPVASVKGAQKMKVPVGKNWKPTLIPVTSSGSAADRRVSGLVQVISGGKPYHISLQDYNKMCYLKRNQEMKRMAETKNQNEQTSPSSVLKPVIPRKNKAVTITATKTSSSAKDGPSTSASHNPAESKEANGGPPEVKRSKPIMILPKIPKSLTVIPQTVTRKPTQPPSPTLSITSKPSTSRS